MARPPSWLTDLANKVAEHIEPIGLLTPIGCHFHRGELGWEITVFASAAEVVGGANDGQRFETQFQIDVKSLLSLLTTTTAIHWQAQRLEADDELGAHLAIEGFCEGKPVWICIPASPPAQFEPSRQIHVDQKTCKHVW